MPLSKERNRVRMRKFRLHTKLNSNPYLAGHLKTYPSYLDEFKAGAYNPELDPYINPLLRHV